MTKNFIVYFETLDNKFRTYNLKHNKYETINRLPLDISNFSMTRVKNLRNLKLEVVFLKRSDKALVIRQWNYKVLLFRGCSVPLFAILPRPLQVALHLNLTKPLVLVLLVRRCSYMT